MPIPLNKAALDKAIRSTYSKLKEELILIDPSDAYKLTMNGHAKGTMMSPANLVSYLIGWGQIVLKWNRKYMNNEEIHFPDDGFKWNELGLIAQKLYVDYKSDSYVQLIEQLDQTVDSILKLVEEKDETFLYETDFYGKYPFGRMIQWNSASPYKNALTRIKVWKKAQQKTKE